MDELEIELETLTSKLKEGAEKISNWTNEEQTKLVLSIAEQGETFLSKFDGIFMQVVNFALHTDRLLIV